MSETIRSSVNNRIATLTLDRPKALNSLSLDMVRAITQSLLAWRESSLVDAVVIESASEKAFCAGGDIRFFHQIGSRSPQNGSALLEDFFTEEYALNHLIHHYPKSYIALMDGIVMGGGMGISQCFSSGRMRIVTERTKMAMPEVKIGLFPDIGASFFLSRCPGRTGLYLALSGQTIGAADALYTGLADVYLPSAQLGALKASLAAIHATDLCAHIRAFAAPFAEQALPEIGLLAIQRSAIDRHFALGSVADIQSSLENDGGPFAQQTLLAMRSRSPLMMCVTLDQLRRGVSMDIGDCLRMERTMMRHCFTGTEALEGIRAVVVDKDQHPMWSPATLDQVTMEMVEDFFRPVWPDYIHPLRCWL